ncbi:phage integrase SAM-like domain-containing protein [Robiginitalea marina]|uniref:Site-specific integrase n=1 Tax=Robiginitalea marina TaxID=2954105 RepID=A0ABT1AUH5_9FLAO|nr:phage integrase SAM-like domain-containing protein [Robiginitalea marina]MCO5723217.1 site-specific integrase [Robiginitalea marina]
MTPELTRLLGELQDRVDYANRMNLGYDQAMEVIDNGYANNQKQIEYHKQKLAELEKKEPKLLIDFIKEMIHEKETKGLSVRHFEELVKEMENWQGDSLDINDISYRKLREYEHFKRQNSITNGAIIHKTIRTLRTVFNEAKRRGLIHNLNVDPFEGLKIAVKQKPNDDKAITKDDLAAFRDFKPKKSTTKKNLDNMMRARDLFMLQIYIGGHDMADVANLKWSDIHEVDGIRRIRFQRFKLRSRNNSVWVDNAITPKAQEIIDKYGTPDEERIFGWLANPDTESYRQHNANQRKTLGRICDTMDIRKLKTKDPRRIFRSIGGQLGINEILLNQMMGHKPSTVSQRYQQNLSREAQDKAHREIIDNLFITKVQKPTRKAGNKVLQTLEEMEIDFPDRNPDLIYLS